MDKKERKLIRHRIELECAAREKVASYLFDMSKLAFGGVAVGAGFALISNPTNRWYLQSLMFGVYLTFVFAYIAYKILQYNNALLCTEQ